MKLFGNVFSEKPHSIYKSIAEGNLEEISAYLKKAPDMASDFESESMLHYAIDNCENNYEDIIKFLINISADINSHHSRLSDTPLHRLSARVKPHIELIKLLLDKGAEVNARNISDKTPVFGCSFSYSAELLKLLAQYGADVNAADKYGNTLLHDDYINCDPENFEEFLKELLNLRFDINARNPSGYTPLGFSKNKKFDDILKKYGAEN